MDTWPLWVNPNFSNRIMGRVSEFIFRDFISAAEGERRKRRRRRRRDNAGRILAMAIVVGRGKLNGFLRNVENVRGSYSDLNMLSFIIVDLNLVLKPLVSEWGRRRATYTGLTFFVGPTTPIGFLAQRSHFALLPNIYNTINFFFFLILSNCKRSGLFDHKIIKI